MSIRNGQMMKKNLTTEFLLSKRKPFFALFLSSPVAMAKAGHVSQNARIKSSVVNLYSCKKRAPKYKWLKSNGELGIGS